MKIGIGLMASGKSLRMGENKLLMNIQGKTMIKHMIDKMDDLKGKENKEEQLDKEDKKRGRKEKVGKSSSSYELEVVVVSCYDEILQLAKKHCFQAVYNKNFALGQSESIKLITKTLSYCDGIMYLPCDQIYIKDTTIDKIIKTFVNHQGKMPVVPSFRGKKSSPVIFPRAFYQELLSLEGDIGGKVLLKDKKVIVIEVEQKEIMDIDNKEDVKMVATLPM